MRFCVVSSRFCGLCRKCKGDARAGNVALYQHRIYQRDNRASQISDLGCRINRTKHDVSRCWVCPASPHYFQKPLFAISALCIRLLCVDRCCSRMLTQAKDLRAICAPRRFGTFHDGCCCHGAVRHFSHPSLQRPQFAIILLS